MEFTRGLGKEAQVWVDGRLLTVCDGLSQANQPCPPGILHNVRFTYVTLEGFTWEQALRGNPARRKQLEPVRRWSYAGYGQVLSILPVMVDFGLLVMEDPHWTYEERMAGRYVRIPIDRLEISGVSPP